MRILPKLGFAFCVALCLNSCGQQDVSPVHSSVTPSSEPVVHGSMMASVDGKDWSAGGSPAETRMEDATASVDPNTGMVTITGRKYTYHALKADNLEEIAITLKQLSPGVYALAPDFNNFQTATFTKGLSTPTTYFIQDKQNGTATITRVDSAEHRIFGTFSFNCKNAKGEPLSVTQGSFDNIHYDPPILATAVSSR